MSITESIEGYEDMSPQDKLQALEKLESEAKANEAEVETETVDKGEPKDVNTKETPKAPETDYKLKKRIDELTKTVADYKRKERARMTEQEQREEERKEREAEKDQLIADLQKEKTISRHTASWIGLGMDEPIASETAQYLADNDLDGVFVNVKKLLLAQEKAVLAKAMKTTPRPPGSESEDAANRAWDAKMAQWIGVDPIYNK